MPYLKYLRSMIKIVLLGAGNLAYHLTNCLLNNTAVEVVQVYNRSIKKIDYLKDKTAVTNNLAELKLADIYIIAVSDNSISELSKYINAKNKLVVHTSGCVDINEIQSDSNKGVFYPLQSFSKDKSVDFSEIPICIEASTKKDLELLENLAKSISNNIYNINSEQRKSLHASAVFVNNFVNHLYYLGHEICKDNNVPFEILSPLIQETAKKIESLTPFEAQTGPAKRFDTQTIEQHLQLLSKNQQEIYTLLTKSIQNTYGKKL
jgi:predicted short-subunit dehydrogenase-like oxidoreductase (DUF2520 family)